MKFILGLKKEMTQIFSEDGQVVPVTVVNIPLCQIVNVKTSDGKDGYNAVQVGVQGKKKLSKSRLGQIKDLANLQFIREFRVVEATSVEKGDSINIETFNVGDKVKVVGISKGKGFQGVVKRHGFKGHKATHGTKDQERSPGSIGPTDPGRVFPGMRMAGHMGSDRVTVKNLKIVKVDTAKSELYIKGAVPGARGGLVMISGDGELEVIKKNAQQAESKEEIKNNEKTVDLAKENKDNGKENQ